MNLEERPIDEFVGKCQTWDPSADGKGDFQYIDLSSIDKDSKKITTIETLPCADAPSRARQLVKTDDVLVATVRPNLNGVALCNGIHDGMTASTGYCVLRPMPDKLDPRYLFQWVKTETFVDRMVSVATGQSYPAVSDGKVKESTIPLPPLAEQKRIAGILDAADALRAKRREALAQLDSLLQATFLDLFGDPVTNPKGWTKAPLGDVALKVTDGDHHTPKRAPSGIKLLSARNVLDGDIDLTNTDFVDEPEYERMIRRCHPERGDILISCSGSIGRVSRIRFDERIALVRSAALVKIDRTKVKSEFVEHFLRTPALKSAMLRAAKSSSQANLFQEPIRNLLALVPPIEIQKQFATLIGSIERHIGLYRNHLAELDALFASLQSRAFRGEL